MLGGASAAGVIGNAALQLFAIALIIAVVTSGALPSLPHSARYPIWLSGLSVLVILTQLIPLPPFLWEGLPGRSGVLHAFRLADVEPGWQPISLTPDGTIAALLALLPVAAMVLTTLASGRSGRRYCAWVLIGVAVLSILLGACQRASGPGSWLYPYAITNGGSAVALFANRNHLGTLLLCAIPFLPALLLSGNGARGWQGWTVAGLSLVLAGGAALTGSIAALLLLGPALAGCWFVASDPRQQSLRRGTGAVLALLPLIAVAGVWNFVPQAGSSDPQHRSAITPLTLRAALDFMPFGSGGGSFRRIYPAYESPDAASPEYINHAHNDYAELTLEYGVPGVLIALGAIGLWAGRMRKLWSTTESGWRFARAGGVAVGIVLLHSLVDYPARTAAIAAVVAFAATLMVSPLALVEEPRRRSRSSRTRSGSLMVMIDDL